MTHMQCIYTTTSLLENKTENVKKKKKLMNTRMIDL